MALSRRGPGGVSGILYTRERDHRCITMHDHAHVITWRMWPRDAALLLLSLVRTASSNAAYSADGEDAVRLFVDPRVVAQQQQQDWTPVVGPVAKSPENPLLVEDRLWDVRWDNTYITARYDKEANKFRMWYNGFVSCTGYSQGADKPSTHNACAHPTWHKKFGSRGLMPWNSTTGRPWSALMYAESPGTGGTNFSKYSGGISYPWNGTTGCPDGSLQSGHTGGCNAFTSPTNILLMGEAATGTGVMYDTHEVNESQRYKAIGSLWNYEHCGKRPTNPVHGTKWPPCHCLGVNYSPDGVHFDGQLEDESKYSPGDAPGMDTVGQDDGALDLAIWDDDLKSYWGLVRLDAAVKNHRRTGRWTSDDFKTFTPARQVFEGPSDDYQVYTVQPFRLPQWPKGQYLATAMFFAQDEAQGWVKCELLQTLDFGQNWTRIAPNQQFIPLGAPGQFDSHTVYTAWSGEQLPLLNPTNKAETMFYYAGGDGPHSGDRDDSIGLAWATTHAYAGLRLAALTNRTEIIPAQRLVTHPIINMSVLMSRAQSSLSHPSPVLSVLVDGNVRVGLQTQHDDDVKIFELVDSSDQAALPHPNTPRWLAVPEQVFENLLTTNKKVNGTMSRLVVEAAGPATLFALRGDAVA